MGLIPSSSLLGSQFSGLDPGWVGLPNDFLGAVQRLPTAPSGDDGSNAETNFTSYVIVDQWDFNLNLSLNFQMTG